MSSSREPVRLPSQPFISRAKNRPTIVLFLFIVSLLLGNLSESSVAKAIEKLNMLKTAKTLKDVSVTKQGKITKVTITADGLIKDYNVFTLESPKRIVIDLLNLKNLFPKNVVYTKGSNLKQIRIGIHKKKTRVVLDFSGFRMPPYRIDRVKKELIVLLGDIKSLASLIRIMPIMDQELLSIPPTKFLIVKISGIASKLLVTRLTLWAVRGQVGPTKRLKASI